MAPDVVGLAVGEWRVEEEVLVERGVMHRRDCERVTGGTPMWAGCTIQSVDAPRRCDECRPRLVRVRGGAPACRQCGLPLIDDEKGTCRLCA